MSTTKIPIQQVLSRHNLWYQKRLRAYSDSIVTNSSHTNTVIADTGDTTVTASKPATAVAGLLAVTVVSPVSAITVLV